MISFFVAGDPKPAGSKRGIPIYRGHKGHKEFTGHVAVVDACESSQDWKRTVHIESKQQFLAAKHPMFTGPVTLTLVFAMRRPKAHFGSGKNLLIVKPSAPKDHVIKPDVTKLVRAVEDALTGVAWVDDAQVVEQKVFKYYAVFEPGVSITIEEPSLIAGPLTSPAWRV